MDRRDLSKVILGSVAGTALLSKPAEAQSCIAPCYAQTAAESAASVTPTNLSYPPGDVRRYGAVGNGTTDSTAAFTKSIAANDQTLAPVGTYRLDSTVTVTEGKSLVLSKGAVLQRGGAATTPVVILRGKFTELRGGSVRTANASPNGVVVLGHPNTATEMDAWWWRFTDCDVYARVNQVNDLVVYVPSSQVYFPARANYFGLIQNVNIHGGDIQLYLPELSNAHNINNIQFWNGRTAGLRLRGAYANNCANLFFHQSAANGYIAIQLQNMVDLGGQHHSIFNNITGWTSETSGALDQSLQIETNCELNYIAGGSNVPGGWTVNNQNNHVVINAETIASRGFKTASAASIGTNLAVGGTATLGSFVLGGVGGGTGKQVATSAIASGSAEFITPAGFLGVAPGGAVLAIINISDTTNNNLCRTDLLLLSLRHAAHSPSTVTVISNAFTNTGTLGEPTAAAYTLDFSGGFTTPRLRANVTRIGGFGNLNVRVTAVTA